MKVRVRKARRPRRPWFHSIVQFFQMLFDAFRRAAGKPARPRPKRPPRPKSAAPTKCGDCGRPLIEEEQPIGLCAVCVETDDEEEVADDDAR